MNSSELLQRINVKELLLLNNVEETLNKLLAKSMVAEDREVLDYKL